MPMSPYVPMSPHLQACHTSTPSMTFVCSSRSAALRTCGAAIVLLIVAHALRHVEHKPEQATLAAPATPQPTPLALSPELLDALRAALAPVTVTEEPQRQPTFPVSQDEQRASAAQEATAGHHNEESASKDEQRVSSAVG